MKKPLFTVPLFLLLSCTDLGVEPWVALEITTEKQLYLPGDTVSVTIANVGPATVFWAQPCGWMIQDRRQDEWRPFFSPICVALIALPPIPIRGGETVTFRWEAPQQPGEYRFSFALWKGEQRADPLPTDERSSNSFLVSE